MRFVILCLAWITPAAIAGVLGWSGISGYGNAFIEFLIPIPLAGGVFHVPSFVIATAVILSTNRLPPTAARWIPVLAFAVLIAALSLALDFQRLNSWLFTNYEPYGSPFRLDGNPLFLFIGTDAFWVGAYALVAGHSAPLRYWSVLPVVPVVVVAISAISYQSSGPVFQMGGSSPGTSRGDEARMVYTSMSYDEATLRNWIDGLDSVLPWENVNTEHVAIIFTNNMNAIKWGRFDEIQSNSAVGTFCLYEEDRSIHAHSGYYDCFADRNTAEEDIAELLANESTGLGRDIDMWFAGIRMCDSVDLSADNDPDIARPGICRGMLNVYPRRLSTFVEKYGEDSEQVAFVRAQAISRGLDEQ